MNRNAEVLFLKAATAERQGRLAEARAIYQQLVARFPGDRRARARLARLGAAQASAPLAPPSIEPPRTEIAALTEAMGANDTDRVIDRATQLLASHPRSFTLPCFIGEAHAARDDWAPAIAAYERAAQANPGCGRTRGRLAFLLFQARRIGEAEAMFAQAEKLDPDNHLTLHGKGLALNDMEQFDEAEGVLRRALAIAPDHHPARVALAFALAGLERHDEAVDLCRDALASHPRNMALLRILGSVLTRKGLHDEAELVWREALSVRPGDLDTLSDLGLTMTHQGRGAEADRLFDAVLAERPGHLQATFHRSQLRLLDGDHAEGFALYECRKLLSKPFGVLDFPAPEWLGEEDLAGKSLFLHSEQGLGDTFQFCRYAGLARDRGARVTLSVQNALGPLLRDGLPGIEVMTGIPRDRRFDFHAALLSMPFAFRTRVESIPAPIPYVRSDPARAAAWAERLGPHGFRVGLCWQGGMRGANDNRSLPLSALAPLAGIAGLRLISLQKGADLSSAPAGLGLEDPGPDFDGPGAAFLDTAAVMRNCHLVISVDTSVPHLAGALGIPVWLALPWQAEWRWLRNREDTPWYPGMRLFRQESPGDWGSVTARLRAGLVERIAGSARGSPQ